MDDELLSVARDGPAWVALASKVEQLKGELDEAQDQILQLRILLREVEWKGFGDNWPTCPVCVNEPEEGHTSDCRLKAALEGRDA